MAKVLHCRDVGLDCDFIARAQTEAELLRLVAAHASKVHGLDAGAPGVLEKVRTAIRDEGRQGEE
jgi:predicted small metal-binding protein